MDQATLKTMGELELERQQKARCRIFCCANTPCLSSGSAAVRDVLQQAVADNHAHGDVELVPVGCMGLCSRGPLVKVQTAGQPEALYQHVDANAAHGIVARHIRLDGSAHGLLASHALRQDIPFFTRQKKIVLANAGQIDPERLDDYVAHGGYQALEKVLREMTPVEVCDEITRSGLRGRGGAGYPTGVKWRFGNRASDAIKFIVANADEGDPGAYMDRTTLEADPFRLLEGMAIAGYAIGAPQGYIYVRGEYPIAIKYLETAIRSARRQKLLGANLFGSGFSFNVEIRIGAGAFVCGEETALMRSIEGQRGTPRMRPPYPTDSGLWGHPTVINNVETLACVAPIIRHGADWYAAIGTAKSKGTKVFALTGKLVNTGLIEVPMGITLREIVYDIGGGIPGGRAFKAAQTGGPSGGCIPAAHLDTPIDYESLKSLGSIMGSGGLIVMDDANSMPEIARFYMEFCVDESCGKCVPCRVGTVQMYRLLDRIVQGKAQPSDLAKLETLCQRVQKTSLCGLGQTAPNPVLSTLRFFRHEYEALLQQPA